VGCTKRRAEIVVRGQFMSVLETLNIAAHLDCLTQRDWEDLSIFFPEIMCWGVYMPSSVELAVMAEKQPELRTQLNEVLVRRWPQAAFDQSVTI